MREFTRQEVSRIMVLSEKAIEITLIEPTRTGLEKSIMDATGLVRLYLREKNIHDYGIQKQGQQNKVVIKSYYVDNNQIIVTNASLYRPNTKNGDPRIWFQGLSRYAFPNDILALLAYQNSIFVLNISKLDLEEIINGKRNNPFKEIVNDILSASTQTASELLTLMRGIALRGPIPAVLKADTAIGRTLETLLGIDINSSKKPDFKGIEIKSFRDKRRNRKNLFAQVPDWGMSKFKSSEEILNAFGYVRGEEYKLYCTVSSIIRNSQGLKLNLYSDIRQLVETSDKSSIGDFVIWQLETLHKRLLEKHNETFWVAADTEIIDGLEHFIYKKVEHTKRPIISQFDILLEQGIITLDHLIKRNSSGKVVEKGPLFKIKPNSLNLLFPPSQTYYLLS